MANTFTKRIIFCCGAAIIAGQMPAAFAADAPLVPAHIVPPPMSMQTAHFYAAHPAAWADVAAHLPRRHFGGSAPTAPRVVTNVGGTWTAVTAGASTVGFGSPLLLTDGTVLVANADTPDWYRLTPDSSGNYATGTWAKAASMPKIGGKAYGPLYHASAVLPDGRVIIEGGEYNNSNSGVWTNDGAIFDPVANKWTAVAPPSGTAWEMIGDAESIVLDNGTFMLASCCANPAADVLFNPTTLTWTATGAPTLGNNYQDEQGYDLLPNGNVLTVDVWTNYPNGGANGAEQYTASTGVWTSAGTMPKSLPDSAACGTWEIGPAAVRPNGTVFAFGANTGCSGDATTIDPTDIYNSATGKWIAGPNVPATCGSNSTTACTLADAPAAVLPNGNILFAASSGYGNPPTHFFEVTTKNKIQQVSDPLDNASSSGAYYYNLMVLPNGQILMTDFSNVPEVYTPVAGIFRGTAPLVTSVPTTLAVGSTYTIKGEQLSGRTQGGFYGDDYQGSTNYPIVRITNNATGHVFFARTTNMSSYSIARNAPSTASFTVAAGTESGASTLAVVANGVASKGSAVTIQ